MKNHFHAAIGYDGLFVRAIFFGALQRPKAFDQRLQVMARFKGTVIHNLSFVMVKKRG
jgi:hypothetical protein